MTVDRNMTVKVSAKCPPGIPTDGVDQQSIDLNNMSTHTQPTLSQHIDRISAKMWSDCPSTSWAIVSADTRPIDALIIHDPRYV